MTRLAEPRTPAVSVVIPVYKRSDFVHEVMRSTIAQDPAALNRFEAMLIDCSPDDAKEAFVCDLQSEAPYSLSAGSLRYRSLLV